MSAQGERAEQAVAGRVDTGILGAMADFQDPKQEWRRLVSEAYGTFFLVLVAAGGPMIAQVFPGKVSHRPR